MGRFAPQCPLVGFLDPPTRKPHVSYAPLMIKLMYRGGAANLQLLAGEIRESPELNQHCTVEVTQRETQSDSLQHGQLADIAISVAAGVATNGLYDAIRALIDRARDRGSVESVDSIEHENDD